MRKILRAVLGAALIVGSTHQIAFAKQQHHLRKAAQFTAERFRNTNAAVAAPAVAPSIYRGGWSAPAGR